LNQQANRDYQAVIDAYNSGDGYSRLADITQKNYQHAVGDIVMVHRELEFFLV